MTSLIIVCVLIGLAVLYFNRSYLKDVFKTHIEDNHDDSLPPFCYDCNYYTCSTCRALKIWRKGKDDKEDKAYEAFYEDYLNQ